MDQNDIPGGREDSPTTEPGVSRRTFIGGTIAASVALGAGLAETQVVHAPAAAASSAPAPTALPTTTEPEQLHLAWGSDPTTQVTVSWASPGTVAQPAPTLAYSRHPITADNPGRIVRLPSPRPLDQTRLRTEPDATSFTDGLSGQTTYHYHVPLRDLEPDTTYYYQVSDGAATPTTAGASFTTAARGRVKFRFSSFGDISEPAADRSASGQTLGTYPYDTSYFTVGAIEDPGDGGGAPLFHLVNGDLSYADDNPFNMPAIWRDFSVNVSRSAANRPWMPALGNHEIEYGATSQAGKASATGTWNGPYGDGSYLARYVLPPNGVTNYDGNHLQGNFYGFQVGTVYFIVLDANDVVYQHLGAVGGTFYTGVTIPANTIDNAYSYTGSLVPRASDYSLVPGGKQPNLQTLWLERTLRKARLDPAVDMIVVTMHQCPLSSDEGNGTDLGIRQTWLPLFDEYEVDLVLSGHEHFYERSYAVRGYDDGEYGTVTTAFTTAEGVTYPVGAKFNTRRPTVVATGPTATVNGVDVVDTSKGTVYYIMGGGGAGSTYGYVIDPADGLREARIWTAPDLTVAEYGGNQAWEDATWSAGIGSEYGYGIFDVDPGEHPGETTITVQWFQVPLVEPGATPVMPTEPFSKLSYGRTARWTPGHH